MSRIPDGRIKWLLSRCDPGGEVESDARFEIACDHSGRRNRLRHQDHIWTRAIKSPVCGKMSIPPVIATGGILLSVAIILLMDKDSEPGGYSVILQDGSIPRGAKMRLTDKKAVKQGQSLIETLTYIFACLVKKSVKLQDHFLQEIRAMTTGLSDFFHYHLWANLRLLDACTCLSDAQLDATSQGMFGNVRETLVHIFVADESYVEDLTGTAPTPRLEEFTMFAGFDELRQRAEWSGKELITIAEQRDLGQILHFPPNYDIRGIILLLQALHHAIEHRSQIATLLSLQDIKLPLLDGWGYNNALTGQSGE